MQKAHKIDEYGLSLCIQGTPANLGTVEELKRFIPVYTGNTVPKLSIQYDYTVYPCVYREHLDFLRLVTRIRGLSLCIQGTP